MTARLIVTHNSQEKEIVAGVNQIGSVGTELLPEEQWTEGGTPSTCVSR